MKNTLKILGIIALVAVVMFSVAACKKDKAPAAPVAPVVSAATASWDAALADMEKIANEMAPLVERAQAGDATASVALAELFQKVEGLEEKYAGLDEATMNETQKAKYAEIEAKFLSAINN